MGKFGISLIKHFLTNQRSISEEIKRGLKFLALLTKSSGKSKKYNTSKVTYDQLENKELQEIAAKVNHFREHVNYFSKGITIHQYLTGSTEGEEENMAYYLKHLANLQDYLKTVPEYLHETKEYKAGMNLFTKGLDRYIGALKWHYAF